MKKLQKKYFLKVLLLMALGSVSTTSGANEYDQRQVLSLNKAQQTYVLTEMRSLLKGIETIVSALVADDLEKVTRHARPLGMAMKETPENKLHGILPKAFMMQGKAIHMAFDSIADDAERIKDPKHTLKQISETLQKCQGCHDNYRIKVSDASTSKNKPRTGNDSEQIKRKK
ncbi:MAG: cytochrome c [Methylococcales bacterium]|nr:cytochrome c [Methylococcales bacterium]